MGSAPAPASGPTARGCHSQTQDQRKCVVHGPKLLGVQAPGGASQTLGIHHGGLLDEDSRVLSIKLDRRPERGWTGGSRRRRDERRAQRHELIRLNDHGVAGTLLLAPAGGAWRRQPKDLSPDHLSRSDPARVQSFARE
jgi:hypothetical protein